MGYKELGYDSLESLKEGFFNEYYKFSNMFFPKTYLVNQLASGNKDLLLTDTQGFMIDKGEWEHLKALIDNFFETYTNEFIKEFNQEKLNENVETPNFSNNTSSRRKREGYIYFLKADNGLTKIGKAINLDKRLDHFTAKLPYQLVLAHSIKSNDYTGLELELHKKFEHLRKRGEWFDLTDMHIKKIKKEYGNEHIA